MNWLKRWLGFIIIFASFNKICASQTAENINLEPFIEELFNTQESSVNYEEFYESLLLLHQSPLNLNTVSTDKLRNTFILSATQIANLQNYILEKGKLVTLFELQIIDGFNYETIQRLLPFVIVNPNEAVADDRPLLRRIFTERNNYFIIRFKQVLEKRRGYTSPSDPDDNRYIGSPSQLYLRYRIAKPGDFSFGFTSEKDPGEALAWDPKTKKYGMDYWSVHLMLENQGKFRKVILGDYQLQFGQGLLFGAGFSVGKGSETINTVQRATLGIRPYSSVLESGFMRGAAATYKFNNKISLTGFYSRLKQDANIHTSDDVEEFFSALQTSGLHRTPSEISNKRKISEQLLGVNMGYALNRQLTIGAQAVFSQFDLPIRLGNKPYQFFEFQGKNNFNASVYGDFNWRGFSFFGEAAVSKSGGIGSVFGLTKNLTSRLEFALVLRNYDKDFHTFRGGAFGENSRNINEYGIYWGFKYTLNRKLFLSAYYDTFRFPWLKQRVNAPSSGNDYLVRLNFNPGANVRMYAQTRKRVRGLNTLSSETNRTIIMPSTKKQYTINIEFNATPDLKLKSRIQWSNFYINSTKTSGIAFIQDASYRFSDWSFSGRIAFFDTEGGENRQYAYERDVLYAFSIPAYSGRGVRNYLLIQYHMGRKIDLWARLAQTTYYDRYEIGTGLETINGNQQTEFKIQMRYKLR